MASIVRRNQEAPLAQDPQRWDPYQLMRELTGFDPFAVLERSLDPGASALLRGGRASFAPAFDLKETREAYILKADLPGVREEDVDVSVTGNRLTVRGQRESERREEGDTQYIYERSHGAFTRSFTLPEGVDADRVEADLDDGVLTVRLPKRPEVQPRKVSLKRLKEKVSGKAHA